MQRLAAPITRRPGTSRSLWRAAWSGDEDRFRKKCDAVESEKRKHVLEVDPTSGWTALHFAAVYGRTDMLAEMLDECPDLVEHPNRAGWRPLHYAAGFGRPDVIDMLLERGASLQCTNDVSDPYRGWTPLHRAFRWWLDANKPNAIRHLLGLGADATMQDAMGRTPVDLVSDASCVAAIAALGEAHAAGFETARLSLQNDATLARLRAALVQTAGEAKARESFDPLLG